MSFLKKLFGGPSIDDDIKLTVGLMEEMASESERVHRNMVNIFNKEVDSGMLDGQKTKVSWKGILKTRLLAIMYPASMLNNKWRAQNEQKVLQVMDIATGIAVSSLHDSGIEYDRDKAGEIAMPFMRECLMAIKNEFETGPSKPSSENYTDGFKKLKEISHNSLTESIGKDNYTQEVKMRFQAPIRSGIISALRATTEAFSK